MSKEIILKDKGLPKDDSASKIDCVRDCPDLGHCCKRFVLNPKTIPPFDESRSIKGVRRKLRHFNLPFEPLELAPTATSGNEKLWWFTCPLLGADGKCGDYENRPGTCSSFVPGGGDGLCLIKPEKKEGEESNEQGAG